MGQQWANKHESKRVANHGGTNGNDSLVGDCFIPWAKNRSYGVRDGQGLRCGGVVERVWKL